AIRVALRWAKDPSFRDATALVEVLHGHSIRSTFRQPTMREMRRVARGGRVREDGRTSKHRDPQEGLTGHVRNKSPWQRRGHGFPTTTGNVPRKTKDAVSEAAAQAIAERRHDREPIQAADPDDRHHDTDLGEQYPSIGRRPQRRGE